jgi:hypothetical protein
MSKKRGGRDARSRKEYDNSVHFGIILKTTSRTELKNSEFYFL